MKKHIDIIIFILIIGLAGVLVISQFMRQSTPSDRDQQELSVPDENNEGEQKEESDEKRDETPQDTHREESEDITPMPPLDRDARTGPGCQIDGCSAQVCTSDDEPVITTCQWYPEYVCYRLPGVRCEKNTAGECAWSTDDEFDMCMQDPEAFGGDE